MTEDYNRIEKAIKYLEENFKNQPELEDVAAHLHLSPYHLQRLFRIWAGISPKRFLQFLTVEYAKNLLSESKSILDVTYETGLSSPGRLYDIFVTLDGVTPGEYKSKGEGLRIFYGLHDSPFGKCFLAVTEKGICNLSFITDEEKEEAVESLLFQWGEAELTESQEDTQPWIKKIFFPGPKEERPSINLYLKGTNFQIKVWEALLKIPSGFVSSYEDIATHIGKPSAARAVGNAISENPVAYIIPCHRVIRKTGLVGDYRWGKTRKKAILIREVVNRES